jgi:outer membrane immunogenic protein
MKKFLMGVALGALIAAPASAADLRRPAPQVYAPPPPVVTAYNWTSCYFGGHVGGLWVKKHWHSQEFGDLGSHDANGWLGGIQAGCDWQWAGRWVIGIAADYAWADADGNNVDLTDDRFTNHSKVRSVGSATVRLGYAWDRFLGYVKGGAAWESDHYKVIFDGTDQVATANDKRRLGWTVGVGGEYAFTNWVSAFVEYNFYDFGNKDRNFIEPDGFLFDRINVEERKHVVKGGLNFRWGNWAQPVAARY